MRITCIADLHGNLPAVPQGDLLLIAGDLVPTYISDPLDQMFWIADRFIPWLENLNFKKKLCIVGSHDKWAELPGRIPASLDSYLLHDSSAEYEGLNIYGTPWTVAFGSWSFMLPESSLTEKWNAIPENTDVLIAHQPPFGVADQVGTLNKGSQTLKERIGALHLKLMVVGHLHNNYGVHQFGHTKIIGCSLLNEDYQLMNKPIEIDI